MVVVSGILDGVRVVEVSAFVAAPIAGATLAALGAEVIRVEQIGGGIDSQRWPVHEGRSLYRAGLDRGKRSITLDLRSTRGQQLVADVIARSGEDGGILVTNLGAKGWMSYERLVEARRDLIMVLISGTPDGGAAVDYTVNAGIGFPWVTGPEGWPNPVNHVLPAWDVATGLMTCTAILAAERHRRRTGEGQLVKLALSDVAIAIASHLGFVAEAALVDEPRGRFGNDLYGTYARDFRTRDGRFVMVCALTRRQWKCLVEATGLAAAIASLEDLHKVDFGDEGARFIHRGEISALVEPWVAGRTFDDVRATFDAHEVLWGPYRTFKELVRDDPRASSLSASPVFFTSHSPIPAVSASQIGGDTASVLRDLLELSDEALAELREAGVIN
jgi:2-methylfumaryl-CoA isomerase